MEPASGTAFVYTLGVACARLLHCFCGVLVLDWKRQNSTRLT